jgi:hypothetical protein
MASAYGNHDLPLTLNLLSTTIRCVAGIDELRVKRDRARIRMEIAAAMEAEALKRFSGDSRAFAAWKIAEESVTEARHLLETAEREYMEALAASGPSS